MSDLGNEFNLDELEKMSQEGLDHFDNNVALSEIESETMSSINAQLNQPNTKFKYLKLLGVLALVASLVILLFVLSSNNDSSQKLYASHYDAPQFLLSSTERSGDTQASSLANIKILYAQGKYDDCLSNMKANKGALVKQYPDLKLYQGICQLELGKIDEAITSLLQPSADLEDVRLWYLALAQISADQKQAGIKSLESLLQLSSTYKNSNAKELLIKLNN